MRIRITIEYWRLGNNKWKAWKVSRYDEGFGMPVKGFGLKMKRIFIEAVRGKRISNDRRIRNTAL